MPEVPVLGGGTAERVEVALLDPAGVIVAVNEAWSAFAREGGGDPVRTGVGVSYLAVCDAAGNDPVAREVADAVRTAVRGDLPAALRLEVPCHGPDEDGWYDVLVSSRLADDGRCLGATVTLSRVSGPGVQPGLAGLLARVPDLVEGRADRLEEVPAAARELLRGGTAVLALLSGDGSLASVLRAGPPVGDEGTVGERPGALGLLGLLLARRRPLRLADVTTHPAGVRAVGAGALLGTPVTSRGRVLGALYVVGDRPGGFTDRDEDLLTALARFAGTALDVERRRQALDDRLRWAELSRELTARPLADEPDLLGLVVRLAGRGLGAGRTALVLARADRRGRAAGSPGVGLAAVGAAGDPVVAEAFRTGRSQRGEPGDATVAAVPLQVGGRVLAALTVDRPDSLVDEELRGLEGLAHHAGLALQLLRSRADRHALQALRDRVAEAAGTQDEAVQALFGLALELAGSGGAVGCRAEQRLTALDDAVRLLRSSGLALQLAIDGLPAPTPHAASAGCSELAAIRR